MLLMEETMAEFCLDCWNKLNKTEDSQRKYILSKNLDLCEGCGEWKQVIIMERKAYYIRIFKLFLSPIYIMCNIIYFVWRLLILPYLLFKYRKSKK